MVWGMLLDRLLYDSDISYAELGRIIGTSRNYIYRIVRGSSKPPNLEKLNKIYNYINKKITISKNMEIDFYNTAMIEKYEKSEALSLFMYCNTLKSNS